MGATGIRLRVQSRLVGCVLLFSNILLKLQRRFLQNVSDPKSDGLDRPRIESNSR
jgi:hypothetical protein